MNVEEVQRRLWEQSQEHKGHKNSGGPLFPVNQYDRRIRNLFDLMHHPQWLYAACESVLIRSKGKATGVDRVTVGRNRSDSPNIQAVSVWLTSPERSKNSPELEVII